MAIYQGEYLASFETYRPEIREFEVTGILHIPCLVHTDSMVAYEFQEEYWEGIAVDVDEYSEYQHQCIAYTEYPDTGEFSGVFEIDYLDLMETQLNEEIELEFLDNFELGQTRFLM